MFLLQVKSTCLKRRSNMWYLQVQYKNETHDIVPASMLDQLISSDQIMKFYRPSEKRWVTLGADPVRKEEVAYAGPDKRRLM
jgi:hypothetical protein